jgi:hypothetical protein
MAGALLFLLFRSLREVAICLGNAVRGRLRKNSDGTPLDPAAYSQAKAVRFNFLFVVFCIVITPLFLAVFLVGWVLLPAVACAVLVTWGVYALWRKLIA